MTGETQAVKLGELTKEAVGEATKEAAGEAKKITWESARRVAFRSSKFVIRNSVKMVGVSARLGARAAGGVLKNSGRNVIEQAITKDDLGNEVSLKAGKWAYHSGQQAVRATLAAPRLGREAKEAAKEAIEKGKKAINYVAEKGQAAAQKAKRLGKATAQTAEAVGRAVAGVTKALAALLGNLISALVVAAPILIAAVVVVIIVSGIVLLVSLFTHHAPDEQLVDIYTFMTELDVDFIQEVRDLEGLTNYYLNDSLLAVEELQIETDADYILLLLDVTLEEDYRLDSELKDDLRDLHSELNYYVQEVNPDDTSLKDLKITVRPISEYVTEHPEIYPSDVSDLLEERISAGPYVFRQELGNPFERRWQVTSRFGYRLDPIDGNKVLHQGVDLEAETGTPVKAGMNGVVQVPAFDADGFGKAVVIEDGDKKLVYAHLENVYVSEGQTIEKGAQLGTVGSTGRSTGAHLHLEYHYKDKAMNPVFYLIND